MSQQGDFRYLILDLLKDKPNHGYEIIRKTPRTRCLERRG
jgi:DNA-binding PadR family transcriptional regulator